MQFFQDVLIGNVKLSDGGVFLGLGLGFFSIYFGDEYLKSSFKCSSVLCCLIICLC